MKNETRFYSSVLEVLKYSVVRRSVIPVASTRFTYSTVEFWIMYKNLQIHAMRATFHIVFSVRNRRNCQGQISTDLTLILAAPGDYAQTD